MMHKAWSSIEEVPYCFSRSSDKFQGRTALKIVEFGPNLAFPDCNSQFEFTNGYRMMHKAWSSIEEMPYCFLGSSVKFLGHTTKKIVDFHTRIERFRTVTPIWIHQWVQNEVQSLMYHRRGALLFFKVIHAISRSHGTKKLADFEHFRTVTPVWIYRGVWDDAQSLMSWRRGAL